MTLIQLLNFIKIAEFASFTKAAAVVRIAQPALSRQMRHLEVELNVNLFVRHGWGVTLTEAGEVLRGHTSQILREVERAKDAVAALATEPAGRVTIGVPATLATILLPPLAVMLRAKYPGLRPRFVDDFSAGLHARLLEGAIGGALG